MLESSRSGRTFSRRSLHGQVAHAIGARIIRGELTPGETLPNEADLSLELKVSRTALREAIKLLSAKGLVESRPKTGTRIRPRASWNMLDPDVLNWLVSDGAFEDYADDLFEMRRVIEPAAAAIAAMRGDKAAITNIREAYEDMVVAGENIEAGIEPDLRFHQAILTATGNEFIAPLGALIDSALATSFRISSSRPGAKINSLPRHEAVLTAIATGDSEGAREAMDVLLSDAMNDYHRVVDIDQK
ncbi:MAG: FadR family transcriptional regulator [Proteobacteria bacterium]|nr:FadR family transcriptional regulator [Pseudomonadota bacterium]